MTQTPTRSQCPYLGLAGERTVILTHPDRGHRCYAVEPPDPLDLDHQERYCLTAEHPTCPLYRPFDAGAAPAASAQRGKAGAGPRWLTYGLVAVLALLLIAVIAVYSLDLFGAAVAPATSLPEVLTTPLPAPPAAAVAAATPTSPTPPAVTAPARGESAPVVVAAVAAVYETPTAEPGGKVVAIAPKAGQVGWWTSADQSGGHLDDSYLYAGYYDGQAFAAAMRLDLTSLPRGAPIREATLRLTGLEEGRFDPGAGGTWTAQLLPESALPALNNADFQAVVNAPAGATLFPTLYPADLGRGEVNEFPLDAAARAWLEKQMLDGATAVIVRLLGPGNGDTLFAWDTGMGAATSGAPPLLVISTGALPPTVPPLPTDAFIVATLTATPENVLTAAAAAYTATIIAQTTGTYTPLPYRAVTPTPTPANIATLQAYALVAGLPPIVPDTPTPANEATAQYSALLATAEAYLTGTPTPVPAGAVTPIIIMPTPLPQNVVTEAARRLTATAEIAAGGTPTPWAYSAIQATLTPTHVVITYTPKPANRLTATANAAYATAISLIYGTFTPLPPNAATPTRTPRPRPTAAPKPTQAPQPAPAPTPAS
jgi:hypothetical protein